MKNKIIILSAIILTFTLVLIKPSFSDTKINVYINDQLINFKTPPLIKGGKTLVPADELLKALGAQVNTNGEGIFAKVNDIELNLSEKTMEKNGETVTLSAPMKNKKGKVFAPIRDIAQALDVTVLWDEKEKAVYLYHSANEEVVVSSEEELLSAIKSNTTVILDDKTYNLSKVKAKNTQNIRTNDVLDGQELILEGLINFSLIGKGNCEIVTEPRYAYVLKFINCKNINISNIKIGHTNGGVCYGGVFSFSDSKDIKISNTKMYGCGTEGLSLKNVEGAKIQNSTIYKCTYYIANIENSYEISFENCTFYDNKEFSLVNIKNTKNLTIDNCAFKNNFAIPDREDIFEVINSQNITVKNTQFIENVANKLGGHGIINYQNNYFKNNKFSDGTGIGE